MASPPPWIHTITYTTQKQRQTVLSWWRTCSTLEEGPFTIRLSLGLVSTL